MTLRNRTLVDTLIDRALGSTEGDAGAVPAEASASDTDDTTE
jgi:hypothetical protein